MSLVHLMNGVNQAPKPRYSTDDIIVIAPGSSHFKFGLASLKNPISVPSVFAIRNKPNNPCKRNVNDISHPNALNPHIEKNRYYKINEVIKTEVHGKCLHVPTPELIKNEEKYGEHDSEEPSADKLNSLYIDSNAKIVLGEAARSLPADSNYDILGFFRNGVLNIEDVSEMALKNILIQFLTEVLSTKLKIQSSDFKDYCVAFVVPASFCKAELMFFAEILLERLKFKALFFHLEPVLACFGTGFSGACVVDIGHESTTVSCVQYGSVVPHSRVMLPFGGKDITKLCLDSLLDDHINEFHSPIKRKLADLDAHNLSKNVEKIKKETCSFSRDKRVLRNFVADFLLKNNELVKLKMTLSNTCVVPPLGLFYPAMFSGFYENGGEFLCHYADRCRFEYEKTLLECRPESFVKINSDTKIKNVSLSAAIVDSILSLSKLEDKMSMATSILLVGGSAKLPGLGEFIEEKVKALLKQNKCPISHVEILPRRDERESGLSPEYCSWLGMSIICGNEGCREMWITPAEWEKQRNVYLLRRKLPFVLELGVSNQIKRVHKGY